MAITKANILEETDFTGAFSIPASQIMGENNIEIINYYEYNILIDLLGAELYNEFVADLVNKIPQTQKMD